MSAALERAKKALEVKDKELQEFDVIDPFNNTRLRGWICRRGDHRYGALYITHVDQFQAEQLILAVPKFPYPFDRNGLFRFPQTNRIEAYEKLDGTSVYGYIYRGGGRLWTTYKLRLYPVLRNGRFGPFLDLWKEILQKYPYIPEAVSQYATRQPFKSKALGHGIAFELYGRRNKHLILYDEDIDTRVLFGVASDGWLQPPMALGKLPCPAPGVDVVDTPHDLTALYRTMQAEMDSQLTEDPELSGFVGPEGRVWYMLTTDKTWLAFKCKPETIEAIHFASGGIGTSVIRATAYNVLETDDEVTDEAVIRLLLEEFNNMEIDKVRGLISKVTASVNQEVAFRKQVLEIYEGLGIKLEDDKRAVMRALSQHFPKALMQRVYSAIAKRNHD
jgi:hypothetical protein